DVEHRLRRQTGGGGAADVLERARERAEQRAQPRRLLGETPAATGRRTGARRRGRARGRAQDRPPPEPTLLAVGERLERLADDHLEVAALARKGVPQRDEQLLDRRALAGGELLRPDLLDRLAQLVVPDGPHQPLREQRDDLVVGALDVRARGHRLRAERRPPPPAPRGGGPAAEMLAAPGTRWAPRPRASARRRRAACRRGRPRGTPSPASARSSSASGPERSSSGEPAGSGPRPNASRRGCPRGVGTSRASRLGSSARTVPMPTATASAAARSSCTSRRDASPVTHRSPGTVTRPSSVVATL